MSWFTPTPPPYEISEWQRAPWAQQLRLAARAWAVQGYGTPFSVYFLYLLKILGYVAIWCFFCSRSPSLGPPEELGSWGFEELAFQKAILWSMAFEGLGLGCASGPLTGRYVPPVSAFLHFLRPGTTKLPLLPGFPLLGGAKRTTLEALLYAAHYGFLFRALMAPTLSVDLLLPTVLLLPLLGLSDKTIFLAARAEHYYTTLLCFLFLDDWIVGAMAVQLAMWLWAAISKLNHHFPAVVSAMTSNSPALPFAGLRRRMYRSYPADLRPSALAYAIARLGTAVELCFPFLLAAGQGGWATLLGLTLMVLMHTFITSSIPMAVPLEWNVMTVYAGFFLFWTHADQSLLSLSSPGLAALLFVALVLIPLIGHLHPSRVSFLLAMRYYAGNWAYSIWLFRKEGESYRKLDQHLCKASRWVPDQLALFLDEETIEGLLGKVPAFRTLHLHGRALHALIPRAVDDIEAYQYVDGEVVAGLALGWNFGDGHLHDERLLHTIQQQCGFEAGELRHIFVESQPLGGRGLQWRISDAHTGPIARGEVSVADLLQEQPWPAHASPHAPSEASPPE